MSRDSASLLDIVRAGQLVLEFARDLNRQQLREDLRTQSAILYQVSIMGEATKRLSREFRDRHPEVPWDDLAGMRDVIAHQYDRIDFRNYLESHSTKYSRTSRTSDTFIADKINLSNSKLLSHFLCRASNSNLLYNRSQNYSILSPDRRMRYVKQRILRSESLPTYYLLLITYYF